jgi:hypothetical protein
VWGSDVLFVSPTPTPPLKGRGIKAPSNRRRKI